jgi:hypothetical protein
MKQKINHFFEVLFLIFAPISIENILRSLLGFNYIVGIIGIFVIWIGFSILIKKKIVILL